MQVLIGCDGSRSIVASFLGLKPAKTFRTCAIRGLTSYPNGHSFPLEFVRLIVGQTAVGRLPITDKLVHWFVSVQQGTGMVIQLDASCYNVTSILILFNFDFNCVHQSLIDFVHIQMPSSHKIHKLSNKEQWRQ